MGRGEIKKNAMQKRMKQIHCYEVLKTSKFIVDAKLKRIVETNYLLENRNMFFSCIPSRQWQYMDAEIGNL